MRELASLSIWLREPDGVCSCLLAWEWPQVFWDGGAGLAALCFAQDIPPGDAAPVPHPAEHAWAAAPPFVVARVGSAGKDVWKRAGLHSYLLCTPSCHLRKLLEHLYCHPSPVIQGSGALWGCRLGQHSHSRCQKCHISPSAPTGCLQLHRNLSGMVKPLQETGRMALCQLLCAALGLSLLGPQGLSQGAGALGLKILKSQPWLLPVQ